MSLDEAHTVLVDSYRRLERMNQLYAEIRRAMESAATPPIKGVAIHAASVIARDGPAPHYARGQGLTDYDVIAVMTAAAAGDPDSMRSRMADGTLHPILEASHLLPRQ